MGNNITSIDHAKALQYTVKYIYSSDTKCMMRYMCSNGIH